MRAPSVLLLAIAASAVLAAPSAFANPHASEFASMDSNKDGVVSSSEHEVYARRMFDSIDTNHDDKVTADELNAAEGKVSRHASGPTEYSAAARIRRRDVNGDGIISQGEQADGARQKFIMLDADNNGQLTPQEFASGE
jgi:Ca2+-binding EF-hand superfamily protein